MTLIDEIDAAGNAPHGLGSYGPVLQANKQKLWSACDKVSDVSWELRVLLLALAFQETQHMSVNERDASKDYQGDSANVTLFNLSLDLVKQIGHNGNPWDLNYDENLPAVVALVRDGMRKWGVNRYLNFVRGGRTGFADGVSYGVYDFRNSIKSMAYAIQRDQGLMWDDRRVEVYLQHV
jgi:hypothetical protein